MKLKTSWALIKADHWVFPYLTKYRGLLGLIIGLGTLTFFCGGALMFTSGFLISRSAQRPENILMVYAVIVMTRAFGIGRPSFRYAERLVSHNWVLRIISDFRKRLYQIVESGTKSIYNQTQTGSLFNLLGHDLAAIENFYLRLVFPSVIGWVLYVGGTVALGFFSLGTAVLMAVLLGLVTLLAPLVTVAVMGARDARQKQLEAKAYTDLTDAVLGLQDWILAGRQEEMVAQQMANLDAVGTLQNRNDRFDWWREFWTQSVIGVGVLVLIIFANAYFGSVNVNFIAAFGLVLFPLADAFTSISAGMTNWPRYAASIEDLNRLEAQAADEHGAPVAQATTLPTDTTIVFTNVSFHYPQAENVLNALNLTVKRGEHVALLGRSGVGKTTLLQLLVGDERPQAGSVTIGQTDIQALQAERAQLISILDQNPYLFATSIANNLKLGALDATDDAVWAALEAVQLKALIEQLPDGLATPMAEAGKRFSGGERQRFALARILLQDTPIVVLDEPTVGLDPITEHEVLQTIFRVLAGKTVVWVTHHLTGVEYVDQVVFLEKSGITMQGTPQALVATSPRFRQMLAWDRGESGEMA